jgi:hypothetical protein
MRWWLWLVLLAGVGVGRVVSVSGHVEASESRRGRPEKGEEDAGRADQADGLGKGAGVTKRASMCVGAVLVVREFDA